MRLRMHRDIVLSKTCVAMKMMLSHFHAHLPIAALFAAAGMIAVKIALSAVRRQAIA